MDGKQRGISAITLGDVKAGGHQVKAAKDGYAESVQQVEVMPFHPHVDVSDGVAAQPSCGQVLGTLPSAAASVSAKVAVLDELLLQAVPRTVAANVAPSTTKEIVLGLILSIVCEQRCAAKPLREEHG